MYISRDASFSREFSICTIVTNHDEYQMLRNTLQEKGFNAAKCEFLVADNSQENHFSAYEAIRIFLRQALGRYVLILHQDAVPLDNYDSLVLKIKNLEKIDPNWGVIGNAGKKQSDFKKGYMSLVTHDGLHRTNHNPVKVDSIDENAMIIKGGSGITVSRDLSGYHFYGFDISSVAARLGYNVYVIDFQWRHLSPGTIDRSFLDARDAVEEKMARYSSVVSIATTCTTLYWGRNSLYSILSLCRSAWMLSNQECHKKGLTLLLERASRKHCGFIYIYNIYKNFPRIISHVSFLYRVKKRRVMSDLAWWKSNWKSRIRSVIQ
jgi:hypothetical protein